MTISSGRFGFFRGINGGGVKQKKDARPTVRLWKRVSKRTPSFLYAGFCVCASVINNPGSVFCAAGGFKNGADGFDDVIQTLVNFRNFIAFMLEPNKILFLLR